MKPYTSPVITVRSEASLHEALVQMQTNFIKRIVIADNFKPVGIVTERDINKFLENSKTARALDEIPINHVMKKNPITLVNGTTDHFIQCAMRMDTFHIGSVIFIDNDGKLIGIVTKTDLTKAFSAVYGGRFCVKDYMTEQVLTCRENDSLLYALTTINSNNISRIVVTDNKGNPIGIITTNSFLTHSSYFKDGKTRTNNYLLPTKREAELLVKDIITNELVTVMPDDDLSLAASIMIKNQVSGIPVINKEKKLVGIVTKFDIVKAFGDAGINEKLKKKYREVY